jgi:nucleoside-diphosphate-sugar epimerase
MKVFVAGATGVLGRRVCQRLLTGGHGVYALSRSTANNEKLAAAGVEARPGDLFDSDALTRAVAGCDAVLHLATAIPDGRSPARKWHSNDRIRTEGTRCLLASAQAAGAQLYVQQSIALIYGDRGGEWVDESATLPERQVDILRSSIDMERLVANAGNVGTMVLRFGGFYGADSAQTRMMVALARRRRLPLVGSGDGFTNLIHLDDAAQAVVDAVDRHEGHLGQVFNIVDDEPVTSATLIHYLADVLGAGPPRRIPVWLAKLGAGAPAVNCLLQSFRCRNQRAKDALGWRPAYPTYREGWAAVVGELAPPR